MSVMIVGGAGYIGSHAARYFQEAGEEVIVVDNLLTGHRDAVGDLPFYEVDIRDKEAVVQLMKKEGVDAVVHFAARSLVGESVLKPEEYYDNNVYGMLQLLSAMRECEVDKIIFSSTAAVYGQVEKMPIAEDCDCHPCNPYGKSKYMMEQLMADYDHAYGIKYVALRYFNAAGASKDGKLGERHSPETHLIPILLDTALGRRAEIEIYGSDYPTPDGTCIRDYIHILDLVAAHLLALNYLREGKESSAFNLATKNGFSNLEVLEAARRVTGQAIPHRMGARRAGDPAVLIADSSKAQELLKWKLEHSDIDEMIEDAWNFHRKFFGQEK